MKIVLYSREGCHLCEEAEQVFAEHGLLPEKVDIDLDADLRERFTECVPVVEINGKVRFRGRMDAALLRRIIRAES